ncbi:MAG: AmmeMemoRadiSam system protein B, partial [Planctomycetes bacterium]|nr:AmmeMemoRadiSam system protein B [Planctomycetota bacterium]
MADAKAVAGAGAFAMVIEGTIEALAREITEIISIPTIGIGASPACDGQILVTEDALGLFSDFTPKFVKRFAELGDEIERAAKAYAKEVNDRRMIDLMLALDVERIMPEAAEHHNACGAGAVTAALSAARRLGAASSTLLAHTASYEVLPSSATVDSVGYAGLVFHRAWQPDREDDGPADRPRS